MRVRLTRPGAILWTCLAASHAMAERPCIPLPSEYRVSLDLREAAAVSLLEALACLMGLEAVRAPGTREGLVTLASSFPVPVAMAVVEADRALAREGLRLRRERQTLRLMCHRGRSCGREGASGKPVRVVLRAMDKVAMVTTEATAPSRATLQERGSVMLLAPGYYRLSEDVRSLARLDPMAFVSEGAAWPNVLRIPEPGFFITWLKPNGFFERLGLRVGDLVLDVNGYRLGSIADAFEAYGALQEARILIVRVRRGAESLVMIYEFHAPGL